MRTSETGGYSIFGIGVHRKHELKWLLSKEKATLHALQKVYVYSENAPGWDTTHLTGLYWPVEPLPVTFPQRIR
jgi:hypothetical protein